MFSRALSLYRARGIAGLNLRLLRNMASDEGDRKDQKYLFQGMTTTGIHLDDIDEIMTDVTINSLEQHYPRLEMETTSTRPPLSGHNLMVIQPWVSYANFNEFTDPEIQLEECVSLGNTIHNWKVVEKKIVFSHTLNRKNLLNPKAFEELKDMVASQKGVTAVFFGVELLSGIQLSSLERELRLPVYDRFTVVLNIFRQHAKTKEAKIQLALAELPYIRSHLREIHESSEYSSSAESLKLLVGGVGERFYLKRLDILKKREIKLRAMLNVIRKQRDLTNKLRRKSDLPLVSVVGYTNSGKTSLIKYLTDDESMSPEDRLFATLDVSIHSGQLPSSKTVLYVDTVGFISRIPLLLVEAFSATLKEVQDSDLILHILDLSHPDHRLQYLTVMKALQTLKVPKSVMESVITVGNKMDKLNPNVSPKDLPKCDIQVSVTKTRNMDKLVEIVNNQLMVNIKHERAVIRVENGGDKYQWLKKFTTILNCEADENDPNYLICKVIMTPSAYGRWIKQHGKDNFISIESSLDIDSKQADN